MEKKQSVTREDLVEIQKELDNISKEINHGVVDEFGVDTDIQDNR